MPIWVGKSVQWVDRLNETIGLLASLFMPAMVAVIGFEVLARYAFSAPTTWVYDTALLLFAWGAMLGGALAIQRNTHIQVDVLTARLSPRARAAMDLLTLPLVLFFLVLIIRQVSNAAFDALATGMRRPTDWAPPLILFLAPVPIAAALMILQCYANAIRGLGILTGREVPE